MAGVPDRVQPEKDDRVVARLHLSWCVGELAGEAVVPVGGGS